MAFWEIFFSTVAGDAVKAGDEVAKEIAEQFGEYLGKGLAAVAGVNALKALSAALPHFSESRHISVISAFNGKI